MTFSQRLRHFFRQAPIPSAPVDRSVPTAFVPVTPVYTSAESAVSAAPNVSPDPLPDWLADEASLRDEGVLFGLSEARPDDKVSQIRAFFSRQVAPLDELIDEYSEKISELNLLIEHRESRILTLQAQIDELHQRQPQPNNLLRTVPSVLLSIGVCSCNFHLIDETLHPIFPNRWIAVGIFLAGLFNLFARTSLFYEERPHLSARRVIAEISLPLTASVFVLAQALQTQSAGQAIALFAFIFFLFLLAGNLLLSTLTTLQADLAGLEANRLLAGKKIQMLPVWEAERDALGREVDAIRTQKWPIVKIRNHTQTERTKLNTRRDELVNLFMSEFELARSLRDRLPEQQRKLILDYK